MKVKVELGGEEREIEVVRQGERLRITHQGESVEVRVVHTEGPHFVLEYEQQVGRQVRRRQLRAAGHVDGDRRQLWVNGSLLSYRRLRERQESRTEAAGSLSASIPAVVSEVLVEEGQRVTAGQKLILLESMKMILPVQAPYDGTVTTINCAAGDAVQPGVPLVALDEDA
ncbi:MAG: biotin/lipoyl-containing protein [bacterium]